MFGFQQQKGNCWKFGFFSFFLKEIWRKRKTHNMFSLMWTLNEKSSSNVVFTYWPWTREGHCKGIWYKVLISMFLKCHHPLAKSENGVIDQGIDEDYNLDIFGWEPTLVSQQKSLWIKNIWFSSNIKLIFKYQMSFQTME